MKLEELITFLLVVVFLVGMVTISHSKKISENAIDGDTMKEYAGAREGNG